MLSGEYGNGTTNLKGEFLQGEIGANAGIGFDPKSASFKAHVGAGAEVNLVKVGVSTQVAGVDIAAEARAGANANAKAEVVFDPKTGKFGAGVEAGAFAGGEVTGKVGVKGDLGEVGVKGSARYGIGAEYSGSIGFENGVFSMKNVKVGAALGVGGSVGFDLKLDVFETGSRIAEGGRSAANWIMSKF